MTGRVTVETYEEATLREAFAMFPSGVVALCAEVDGVPVGMAASSFVSVSLDPPLVAVCPQNTSSTWPVLRQSDYLGVSVLGEAQGRAVSALASKTGDRFAGVDTVTADDGAIHVVGASLWLTTTVEHLYPAGDHTIAVLRIVELRMHDEHSPIIFHGSRFHRLHRDTA
ncbi:flavin reductase family protein [Rhodococcus sp. 06-156-3C]|uniref:flavin reductase family protein n=1 Tax=Nocardiaceae TaxID=85025 RepID=UPI000522E492|nr:MULTISPECIES: flavin reductase family protein [Rhodococcus]OZD12574.1 flavin reductase family protein [Rhodococcus sp. 06-156-4a]OZD18017.1 flavin reductase family protein [Rhodococcus sp. 06-156-3C]OZD20423.1 flavin reductase family protein [Rhodococcus sp. 06-156-4C]OZD29267.1 flavin reductase family protein [Rhodococcus sp. 06-156-3]OZD30539.1 flavin reductase family protein [Rhodococcus sp. 06-156-3b]